MKYQEPKIIAKNLPSGSYAAGCPAKERGETCNIVWAQESGCMYCERTN